MSLGLGRPPVRCRGPWTGGGLGLLLELGWGVGGGGAESVGSVVGRAAMLAGMGAGVGPGWDGGVVAVVDDMGCGCRLGWRESLPRAGPPLPPLPRAPPGPLARPRDCG